MNQGRSLFSQLLQYLPHYELAKCVARYRGNARVRSFSCHDQLLCMAFAQMTFRDSLRDTICSLRASGTTLYHLGIRGRVSRSTLADANEKRDWRIWADLAQVLIAQARALYIDQPMDVRLRGCVYALDSTTIELCMGLFPWAAYKATQRAIKLHTLLDLRGNIPVFLRISTGKGKDLLALDQLIIEPGACYVLDRGYLDFARLHRFTRAHAFFVTRARKDFRFRRIASRPANKPAGIICDQTVELIWHYTRKGYPAPLRRVRFVDPQTGKRLVFLSNNFTFSATTIAWLYRRRWQVELFFKWVKQYLRMKAFFGTSPNAVRTQVWIGVIVYVLLAIVKKRESLDVTPSQMLTILSVRAFEKTPINQAFLENMDPEARRQNHNQLELFDL
jgi:transposase/lambda repressor-like predicted transcriptional regulator